jgi:hypothetical protein
VVDFVEFEFWIPFAHAIHVFMTCKTSECFLRFVCVKSTGRERTVDVMTPFPYVQRDKRL